MFRFICGVLCFAGEVLAWLSVWSEVQRFAYGPAAATSSFDDLLKERQVRETQ